jgi:hypothetical protein
MVICKDLPITFFLPARKIRSDVWSVEYGRNAWIASPQYNELDSLTMDDRELMSGLSAGEEGHLEIRTLQSDLIIEVAALSSSDWLAKLSLPTIKYVGTARKRKFVRSDVYALPVPRETNQLNVPESGYYVCCQWVGFVLIGTTRSSR